MDDRTSQLLEEFDNTWKGRQSDSNDRERNKLIKQFNNLPLEQQYEVLLEAAKTIDYNRDNDRGGPTGRYPFFFGHNKESRIIDILNYKFPNGIKSVGEVRSDNELEDGVIPSKLYCYLLNFFPGYDGYDDLVTKTNIFKDENGEIDTKKISEYWANPNMDFLYRQEHYKEIFRYLDPDTDRDGIIKIIEAEIISGLRFDYNNDYFHYEMPEKVFMARAFKVMFDKTTSFMKHPAYKDKKDNIGTVEVISAIVNERTPTSSYSCEDRIKRNIMGMYGSFEKIVKNKYKDSPIFQYTPEMIEAVYATCIGSVYSSISNEAVLEVEDILKAVKETGLHIPGLEPKEGGSR